MTAFILYAGALVALLALALGALLGASLRAARREEDARRVRCARALRRPMIVSSRYIGTERRAAPRRVREAARRAA